MAEEGLFNEKMAPSELQANGSDVGSSKALNLKVIGLNCGTSVDGVDCVHVHYTQEHPDAPLKAELLAYDEGTFLETTFSESYPLEFY